MSALAPGTALYCHDGSLEGLLCVVFEAYARHEAPASICVGTDVQLGFTQELVDVTSDFRLAQRVRAGIERCGGSRAWACVSRAFLSDAPDRDTALFAYIAHIMEHGQRGVADAAAPSVARVEQLVTGVLNERERMFQFLRFEELEGGVMFARINPRACVVPLLLGHFHARLGTQPFVIFDEAHGVVGVCDGQASTIVLAESVDVPPRSPDERGYQLLWKRFYDSIANEMRYAPALRRQLMPKRLWRNITELAVVGRGMPGAVASTSSG